MRIIVLGANGQVGHEVAAAAAPLGDVIARGRREVDFSDLAGVRRSVQEARPHVIVNAAAYNAVDLAESEPSVAQRINAEAVGVLGEEAKRLGAALIHYSTDFVFDGRIDRPYVETDPTGPLSAYGRSKLGGERALSDVDAPALILRTAWVYSLRRKSFVSMILQRARERETLRVVVDQVGSPTWARDLARATVALVRGLGSNPGASARDVRGIYHAAGTGYCSRYDLAVTALRLDPHRQRHRVHTVLQARAEDFPAPAARPAFAPLDCTKLRDAFGVALPAWPEGLAEALTTERSGHSPIA